MKYENRIVMIFLQIETLKNGQHLKEEVAVI